MYIFPVASAISYGIHVFTIAKNVNIAYYVTMWAYCSHLEFSLVWYTECIIKNMDTVLLNGKIRTAIVLLSVIGVFTMGYLTYLHYAPVPAGGSFCDIGEVFSCSVVNKSAYSEMLGIPMSAFGVFYFGLVAILAFFRYTPQFVAFVAIFLIALLGPSLYLSVISKTVLGSMCILCEFSKILMASIVALALFAVGPKNFGLQRMVLALALAIALASIMYFVNSWTITNPFTYTSNIFPWEFFR